MIPPIKNPFYIAAPAYRQSSAGVTVLYILCHYLNLAGEAAYILHYLPETAPDERLPGGISRQLQKEFPAGLLAPLVTQDILDFYNQRRLTPVVIYPEIFDNPLNAAFFGRYLLNYPGKLANRYEQQAAFEIGYSKTLSTHCTAPVTDVLFIPTCDPGFWIPSTAAERNGACHYALRLQASGKLDPATLPAKSTEILPGPEMSREEIREIFQRSEAFYCYDDSALAIEAILCGCPTVFVPNQLFTGKILAADEVGTDGHCGAGDPEGFRRAQATTGNLRATMAAHIAAIPGQIAELGAKWRALAAQQDYRGPLTYPFEPRLVLFHPPAP
jgi:hypothetical protein